MWLQHLDFKNFVKDNWKRDYGVLRRDHFRICAGTFKYLVYQWNKNTFGNVSDKKKDLMLRISDIQEENMCNCNADLKLEMKLKDVLQQVLKQEEIMWAQKAKFNWLKLGDQNIYTKFNQGLPLEK